MGGQTERPEIEMLGGKVVGRRRYDRVRLEDAGRVQETAISLRGTPDLVPRGVYRFRTFEEADAWMMKMIARTHARHCARTSSASVKR